MIRQMRELGIRTPWAMMRVFRNFLVTVWDPTRSDIQGGINTLIYRALADAPPDAAAEIERARPELTALYREGYDPDVAPERLDGLPDGTLGREYVRFIRDNDIDPLATLMTMGEPKNVLEYLFKRAYKLHDVMHVVLGTDASVLGEVRIVSYSLGQSLQSPRRTPQRAPALALAVLFMNLGIRRPQEMPEAVRLAARWLAIGETTTPHATFRVEDWFDRPVAEVRAAMLGDALERAA